MYYKLPRGFHRLFKKKEVKHFNKQKPIFADDHSRDDYFQKFYQSQMILVSLEERN